MSCHCATVLSTIQSGTDESFEEGRLGGRNYLPRSGKFVNCTIIKNTVLDLLFPIHCVLCKKEKTHCCENCFSKIPLSSDPSPTHGILAAAQHQENSPLAELIHRFKYDGAREIGELLAALTKRIRKNSSLFQNAVLLPVPLHWRRQNMRGFNQSEILASEIGKMHGIATKNLLIRQRYTRPQIELSGSARKKNLIDAFSYKNPKEQLDPSLTYFLIDDVCTTGATLYECAKVLKKHGATQIFGFVIARAV